MARSGGDTQSMDSAEDTMSDASTTAPLTPIQGGDGRWQTADAAEPYMQSGYEALAQREYESSTGQKEIYSHYGSAVGGYKHATDPVYNNISEIHKYPNVGGDCTYWGSPQFFYSASRYKIDPNFSHSLMYNC